MLNRSQFVRNVLVNWLAMLANMLVPFFLSPFTVHRLGNALYGIWVLIVSSVVYFNLLDLGMRNAVVSFVARAYSEQAHGEASRVIATAIWLRLGIGLVILLLSVALAAVFPLLFGIPRALFPTVRLAIVLSALGIAMSLAFGITGAILSALHRFDLLSSVTIARVLLRAGGIVWLLSRGHGLVAMALWELSVALLVGLAQSWICLREYPGLREGCGRPDWDTARKIWAYGSYASVITLAGAILYYSDNIVVGAILGSTAVTFYAIAGTLGSSAGQVVAALSSTFAPLASSLDAAGKSEQLRRLLVQGTRASLLLFLPISCALFFRGQTFIGLWMGHDYAAVSGVVLQILLLNCVLTTANGSSCSIAYGLAKHRPIMVWALVEAGVNLTLSILLARRIGIYGVAWGTAIAGVICNLMFWPRHVARLVRISPGEYIWKAWGAATLASVPFGIACYWEERHLTANSLPAYFLQIAAILPLSLLAAAVLFRQELTQYLRHLLKRNVILYAR
jgi:O-antigen/teichoic acid export membrane protein